MVAPGLFFVKHTKYKGFVDKKSVIFENMVQLQSIYEAG
jgi:hypothetical protein